MYNKTPDLTAIPDQAIYDEFQRRMKCAQYPQQKIVLFGPPGSGKGTQGLRLTHELCSCHISTGDLLRQEIRDKSDLGTEAKDIMNAGGLVPDDIVIKILQRKLSTPECSKGAVFDGFPRTFQQAKKLDEMLSETGSKINHVFNFEIDDEALLDRLAGRRVHETSGRTYHVKYNPPKVQDIDDETGEPLVQRSDDKPESIRNRLRTYSEKTKPVLDYYLSRGVLKNLNASQGIKTVWENISKSVFNKEA